MIIITVPQPNWKAVTVAGNGYTLRTYIQRVNTDSCILDKHITLVSSPKIPLVSDFKVLNRMNKESHFHVFWI